jgi:histone-lysine N-methyltransferase SETD3
MYSRPTSSNSSSRRKQIDASTRASPFSAASSSSSTSSTSASATNNHNTNSSNNIHQDKYDRFEQWLRDNGAQFELLQLCEYDSLEATAASNHSTRQPSEHSQQQPTTHNNAPAAYYNEEKKEATQFAMEQDGNDTSSELRGVYAKAFIPPSTVCMSIPRKCLITVEMGQATPIGQLIMQSDLDLDAPKHIFLMVYLLWDRRVNGSRR